ncbi:hypothetical protein C922_05395 [Plasmodium inui San Antonio 1]|uniref:Uncharacterized protein n=1 Tax=Plasmodium inui San Antonio 1 TaxID=1237626 RepID=W7A549_9APIC|nr:hypothetical protein C922_05395 [Plasmodium inui San Antonio 1]EUD64229.1 hypothetical protein C922_05395 [Plasmodium inui San Antonio 1]
MAISGFLTIENPDTSVLFRQKFLNIHALHLKVLNMNLGDALALETHTQIARKREYPYNDATRKREDKHIGKYVKEYSIPIKRNDIEYNLWRRLQPRNLFTMMRPEETFKQ